MPSDLPTPAIDEQDNPPLTGHCYCGATYLSAKKPPQIVTYCHCDDCRRITGAPVAAFAAFCPNDLDIAPNPGPVSVNPGVDRWFCRTCGSPLAAQFDYLPDQVYVPIGVLDQAVDLVPGLHCHSDARLPWLRIDDDLAQSTASGRGTLQAVKSKTDDNS